MRVIPLQGCSRFSTLPEGRSLRQSDAGAWAIHEAEGAPVRALNSYEARLVNSTIAACAAREQAGCAQVRRDLVAAREATARLTTAWREAVGANQGDDLAAVTANMRAESSARRAVLDGYRERLGALNDQLRVQLSQGNWDYDGYMHGLANGMVLAAATMRGEDPAFLEAPPVWGRDAGTLRGRYRLARGRRSSVLGAACEALGGWLGAL